MASTLNIAIKIKRLQMELEKITPDTNHKGFMSIDNVNRYRAYKGKSRHQSEYEREGVKFGVRICKPGRKGIYNT